MNNKASSWIQDARNSHPFLRHTFLEFYMLSVCANASLKCLKTVHCRIFFSLKHGGCIWKRVLCICEQTDKVSDQLKVIWQKDRAISLLTIWDTNTKICKATELSHTGSHSVVPSQSISRLPALSLVLRSVKHYNMHGLFKQREIHMCISHSLRIACRFMNRCLIRQTGSEITQNQYRLPPKDTYMCFTWWNLNYWHVQQQKGKLLMSQISCKFTFPCSTLGNYMWTSLLYEKE